MPRGGDADFPVARLVARANEDPADGLGNLVDRVTVMVHRHREGRPPVAGPGPDARALVAACRDAPDLIRDALSDFDFRRATAAVWRIAEEADRHVEQVRPWDLARAEHDGDADAARRPAATIAVLLTACRVPATELTPFVPTPAARLSEQCVSPTGQPSRPRALFPRL